MFLYKIMQLYNWQIKNTHRYVQKDNSRQITAKFSLPV